MLADFYTGYPANRTFSLFLHKTLFMDLPADFTRRTRYLLGDEYEAFRESLDDAPCNSLRLNTAKTAVCLSDHVPWCESGYYLPERLTYTFDPLFHAGIYYVQEASSMFLEQVLKQYVHEPVRFLDLCAAPGGKSTHAISVLPEGSFIVSNEIMDSRINILAENIVKWGVGNGGVVVTHNEASDFAFLQHYFDVVLTDVPCSGEGMFRKDKNAIDEWSVGNVAQCSERQRDILDNIWGTLRPGGILIYSTCTYNTEENEQIISYLQTSFGAELLPIAVESEWNIKKGLSGHLEVNRFMPHRTRGEGFFMAALRKPAAEGADRQELISKLLKKISRKSKKESRTEIVPEDIKSWVNDSVMFDFMLKEDKIVALPKRYVDDITMFFSLLDVKYAGIGIASRKGKDWIPEHACAMSVNYNRSAFPEKELSQTQAIAYLRREALQLPPDTPGGFVLLTYKKMPLGWVKNLGTRANNLYPQEWRIRTGYTPEVVKTISDFCYKTEV